MPLFVWDGVLEDYTSGMVCVLARSEKQAWKMIYEKSSLAWWILQGEPHIEGPEKTYSETGYNNVPKCGYFETATRPRKITKPEAFVVFGGG